MKKTIITLAVAFFATLTGLRADTSYLLFQGPFGSGGAVETFKWAVSYQPGTITTGQDLLNAVFGLFTLSGTYTDAYSASYPYLTAGNGTQGAGYEDYKGTPFPISFTLASTTVLQDGSYSPGWNYYVEGGGGASGKDLLGANYDNNGAWFYSNDGQTTRTLANGSFDAWVYGSTYPPATITDGTNAPTAANFTTATVLSVPEPGCASLLLLGAAGILALSKRKRAS